MVEEIMKYLDDTMIHKIYILQSGRILSDYLTKNGQFDLAIGLLKRCSCHDDSKFEMEEIATLISITDKDNFKDPKVQLDDLKKQAIKVHWNNNGHHPEHFENPSEMSELDILEMACDCHSRSVEFGTDFLEFIRIRQEERFQFPHEMYQKYYSYCEILNDGCKSIEYPLKVKVKK